MALKPVHVSMLGVGISAIGVIAMILYYRHQQNAAQTAPANSGAGSFPYFQTAAVPGGGDASSPSSVLQPAAPALDVGALVTALQAGQASANAASDTTAKAVNFTNEFGSIIGNLIGQQSAQLGSAQELSLSGGQSAPIASAGYATPTPGGGFEFGFTNVPIQAGTPNALGWLFGGGPPVFAPNTNPAFGQNVPANSTNSTPPSATVH